MDKQKHNENIKEQFSKQAAGYSAVKAHANSLEMLIEMSKVSKEDNVLDIACGSGIVTCEIAKHARHATGIDITQNMLDQAQKLQAENNLTNIDWVLDDVLPLKFDEKQFSIVITRFSFHHFIDYENVFEEMIRVCKTNGTIMVVDVALPKKKIIAYDNMEKLRDSSHVGALTIDSFDALFQSKKIKNHQQMSYKMEIEMETQLNASCLDSNEIEKLRAIMIEDLDKNNLGIDVKLIDGKYLLSYPIHIHVAQKI